MTLDSAPLDLSDDIVSLTAALIDVPSESLDEEALVNLVEAALLGLEHLHVKRHGNVIIAQTHLGRTERVVLAGHLDTVPENGNLPSRLDDDGILWGLGSCDMKGGVAVMLKIAAEVPAPNRDLTFVFYDAEEIAAVHNGLGKVAREAPEELAGDFAILLEPSNASVEAGCQGTMRVRVTTTGERAHSARAWMGSNAIHALAPALAALHDYTPRQVEIDGLVYREGLNAVGIDGGVSGNVIPDAASLTVNYRFAPNCSESEALAHVREVFSGFDVEVTDSAPGALPGLDRPSAAAFVEAVLAGGGAPVAPKFGWTDVSKFSSLGIPAVNYGPGDPLFAHKADEHVRVRDLESSLERLLAWLA